MRNSLALSLMLHGLFALWIAGVAALSQSFHARQKIPEKLTWIELDPLLEKKFEEKIRTQIVQTSRGREVERAKDGALLGERTQVVDTQTSGEIFKQGKSDRERSKSQKSEEKRTVAPPYFKVTPLAKLGLGLVARQEIKEAAKDHRWSSEGPKEEMTATAPQDYVKGIEKGSRTLLNTKEFVFYGYYQRIRERLDQAWIPILRSRISKLYAGGRKLASEMEYATKVLVSLDARGQVVRVKLIGQSGTEDLDASAVQAFNAAGPFPNPPRGLIGSHREIEIPWEFVLKT